MKFGLLLFAVGMLCLWWFMSVPHYEDDNRLLYQINCRLHNWDECN